MRHHSRHCPRLRHRHRRPPIRRRPKGRRTTNTSRRAAEADGHAHHERPDAYAPIGVMGEHMHPGGEFMASYRYSRMRMDGNRDGTSRVGVDEIVLPDGTYMVSPTDMDMDNAHVRRDVRAHGLGHADGHDSHVRLSMDHVTATSVRFTTKSDGPGDLKLSGLFRLLEREGTWGLHLNAGLNFPTGGLSHKDHVPVPMMGFQKRRLPYPMQIGSGTWDLLPGLTYNGHISCSPGAPRYWEPSAWATTSTTTASGTARTRRPGWRCRCSTE